MVTENSIIVPWDFTKLSEFALEASLKLSHKSGENIVLVHIVESNAQVNESNRKMLAVAQTVLEKYGVSIQVIVRVGNLFRTIHEVAAEFNTRLMIMGTHGVKGMQKYTGSFALKIIENAHVPFLVIQEPVNSNQSLNIVIPVDVKFDRAEILVWVKYFTQLYSCKFHFFTRQLDDKTFQTKLQEHLKYMQNALKQADIECVVVAGEIKGSFTEHIIHYARKIDADMILISSIGHLNMSDYVLGVPEQNLIANWAKIPVICVNSNQN